MPPPDPTLPALRARLSQPLPLHSTTAIGAEPFAVVERAALEELVALAERLERENTRLREAAEDAVENCQPCRIMAPGDTCTFCASLRAALEASE